MSEAPQAPAAAGAGRRIVMATGLLLTCWMVPLAGHAASQELPWNRQPDDDDIVFALPCDQKIVFRRVVTQAGRETVGLHLDDRRILLGRSNDNTAYYDYYRQEFIAGHFTDGDARFYLIGKYEVTEAQYASLMRDDCSGDAELPASDMSWYDAVEFTRRATAYVRANDRAELTAAIGQDAAYFRLPTEAEWEFAARGGLAASTEEFQAERLPLRGDPAQTTWYRNPQLSQSQPEIIGLLDPNPLHLFDVHGNVAEMLLEPFRMNRAGRMHGLAGGFVAKGGSFRSELAQTGNAARREHGYFRDDGAEEYSAADLGFRMVLASPAVTADADAIREEWRRVGQPRRLEGEDPVEQLSALQRDLSDLSIIRSIDEIKQAILTLSSERNDSQYRLLDSLLLGSGRLVLEIRRRHIDIVNRTAMLEVGLPDDLIAEFTEDNIVDESVIADFNYFNHELLSGIASEFSNAEIAERGERVAAELRRRDLRDHDIAEAVSISSLLAQRLATPGGTVDREEILRLATEGQQ